MTSQGLVEAAGLGPSSNVAQSTAEPGPGKETYNEFIHTDLVSAVNSGKNAYNIWIICYTTDYKSQMRTYIGGKTA